MTEPKDTNPKDAMASNRAPLHLVPDTAMVEVSLAFAEGAMKYGAYNWRTAGVKNSVYYSAMRRHLAKWFNGEDRDPATGVKHLASVIASASILLDAERCGVVDDDRPPSVRVPTSEAEQTMVYLRGQLNKAEAGSLNQEVPTGLQAAQSMQNAAFRSYDPVTGEEIEKFVTPYWKPYGRETILK